MVRTLLAASALILSSAAAMAHNHGGEAEPMIGVEAGTEAPAISALTTSGESVDLSGITGENGAVLVFSRSLDWCPFCKAQAIELEDVKADLEAAGWSLNLITYDAPETLAAFAADESLTYTFLSDTGSATIEAFGLRNHDVKAGSRFDGIPHPAIVYITADGTVAGMQREEGYRDRPPSENIPAMVMAFNQSDAE